MMCDRTLLPPEKKGSWATRCDMRRGHRGPHLFEFSNYYYKWWNGSNRIRQDQIADSFEVSRYSHPTDEKPEHTSVLKKW